MNAWPTVSQTSHLRPILRTMHSSITRKIPRMTFVPMNFKLGSGPISLMDGFSNNLADYNRRLGSAAKSGLLAQFGCGPLQIFHSTVRGHACFIAHTRCRPLSVWSWGPKPDWVGLVIALSWKNEFRLNTWTARPGDFFWLDGRNDFRTCAEDRNLIMIGVKRTVFSQAVASLSGSKTPPQIDRRRMPEY